MRGLEKVFFSRENEDKMFESISRFRDIFFSIEFPERTLKHISNPLKNHPVKELICLSGGWLETVMLI